MMRFIHHDNIPARRHRLFAARGIARKEGRAAEGELRGEKRICARIALLHRKATLLVVDAEPKIETAQQFHEPLVREGFRHEDQHALRFPHRQQTLQNQTRLNRFSEPDFVSQEHPRNLARRHFLQNGELVRNQFEPSAEHATHFRLTEPRLRLQRPVAQIKYLARINLPRHQAFLRQIDARDVGNHILPHPPALSHVHEQARVLLDRFNRERDAIARRHLLTGAELHLLEHRRAKGVETFFPRGRKLDADARAIHARDHPKTQFGFPFAHTTLADDTQRHSPS